MKYLIYSCAATILVCFSSNAQRNNPHNKVGLDYIDRYKIIKRDYDAGKISILDQRTIDYYTNATPINNKMSVQQAGEIIQAVRTTTPLQALQNARYSQLSQQSITKAINGSDISKIVDAVKISNIPLIEKQNTLSFLSIIYNTNLNPTVFKNRPKNAFIWTIVGAITGGVVFGPAAILSGASVGGIIAEAKE